MKTGNVTEIFDTLDEKYKYWELLYYIVQEHMPTKKMRFRKTDRPCMTSEWRVPPTPPPPPPLWMFVLVIFCAFLH